MSDMVFWKYKWSFISWITNLLFPVSVIIPFVFVLKCNQLYMLKSKKQAQRNTTVIKPNKM